jgi:hypothetical protein
VTTVRGSDAPGGTSDADDGVLSPYEVQAKLEMEMVSN